MTKRKPSTYGYAILGVVFVFVLINWAVSWARKPDTSALPPLTQAGKPYAAALDDRLQDEGPIWTGGAGLGVEEARCVASPWTMLVGPDELSRLGIDPDEFAAEPDAAFRKAGLGWDDATRLRAAYERCGLTTLELSRRALDLVLADPPPGFSEDEAAATRACAQDQLTSEFTDHAFNASLTTGGLSRNDRDLVLFSNSVLALCEDGGG